MNKLKSGLKTALINAAICAVGVLIGYLYFCVYLPSTGANEALSKMGFIVAVGFAATMFFEFTF